MSRQRRIRDETGGSVYYLIDDSSDSVTGAGHLFDTARALAVNVASKLTGKAAKKIAKKAVEKAVEKGAEKTGEKLGVLLGEKISDKFSQSKSAKNRGDLIVKELEKHDKKLISKQQQEQERVPSAKLKPKSLLLPGDAKQKTRSISEQFNDLLNM